MRPVGSTSDAHDRLDTNNTRLYLHLLKQLLPLSRELEGRNAGVEGEDAAGAGAGGRKSAARKRF